MNCNHCQQTGFTNIHQVDTITLVEYGQHGVDVILKYIKDNPDTNCAVCDCCGDGETWYGEPGYHYGSDDKIGRNGPYAYNGGRAECD